MKNLQLSEVKGLLQGLLEVKADTLSDLGSGHTHSAINSSGCKIKQIK